MVPPGASAPSNLALIVIRNNYTYSVLLTWTPPSPLGDTTGYRISFTGSSSGSVIVSGGSTENFTLTRLRSGEMYNISIVGTSEHFFSKSMGPCCTFRLAKCSDLQLFSLNSFQIIPVVVKEVIMEEIARKVMKKVERRMVMMVEEEVDL